MLQVNILTRYRYHLFDQHIDRQRFDGRIAFHENSAEDVPWDCVVVFDGFAEPVTLRVQDGGLLFVAGEPPDAMTYTGQFLDQFDRSFCAHPAAVRRRNNQIDQYFNNWHFGHDPSEKEFRYRFEQVRDLAPPVKDRDLSVIMSSLAYMPNHLKRRHFLQVLQQRFGAGVDVYGRGHRFIPYKDDAILPYRFHLCIENCVVPGLWTEKIADAFLGFSVPVYAGCPNITDYFPEQALVRLDLDDPEGSLDAIERLLSAPQAEYVRRLPYVLQARDSLLGRYNLIHMLAEFVEARAGQSHRAVRRTLRPNEQTRFYGIENAWLRSRRLVYRKYFELTHRNPTATRAA
jgi:hypothetical protein